MSPQELTTSAANAGAGGDGGGYTTKGCGARERQDWRGCAWPCVAVARGASCRRRAPRGRHAAQGRARPRIAGLAHRLGIDDGGGRTSRTALGEDVAVKDGVLVHSATVLPHNKLKDSIRPSPTGEKKIVI